MSPEERRRILTELARHLLMEAVALGDVRVACFILMQERKGQDPARTLADGVIAAKKRAARPAPAPPTPSQTPRPPRDPDDRMLERVEARLRGELQHEHAVVQAAMADETPSEEPVAHAEPSAAGAATNAHSLVAPPLDGGACQPLQGTEPHAAGAPVEPEHDREEETAAPRRRSARPGPGLLLSDHQRRVVEFLALLRAAAADSPPDQPPTPQAQSP